MTHFTSDEFIDAMEGLLAPDRQAHLATCAVCQQHLAELSGVLNDAKLASVPEPSPLFWQHFSERVRTAIDHEAAPGGNWPSWLRWQVLAPMGALALVVLALAATISRTPENAAPDVDAQTASAEVVAAPDSWATVADLVGSIDVETASAAGVIEPGVAERAVLELTTEEQQELTRLLKAELTRAKS
jgi:hypothetical protein